MKAELFFLDQERRHREHAARVRRQAEKTDDIELCARLIEYAEQLDRLQELCRNLHKTVARARSLGAVLQELTKRKRKEKR